MHLAPLAALFIAARMPQLEPAAAQADAQIHISVTDAHVRCSHGLLHVVVANVLDWRRDGAYCPTAAPSSFRGLIRI